MGARRRIWILPALLVLAVLVSGLLQWTWSQSPSPPPATATLGTPQPYAGGSWVAYRVAPDEPEIQPFLEAMGRVDRKGLGFRALTADLVYDLSINRSDDRPPDATLNGNGEHGNVSISFRHVDGLWEWSGEEITITGPGHFWMGWDEGYWREVAILSCHNDCALEPTKERVSVAYSGTSEGPTDPWDYLFPRPAIGRNSLTWAEATARMTEWHPGDTAP